MTQGLSRNSQSSLIGAFDNLNKLKDVATGNIAAQGQIKQIATAVPDASGVSRVVLTAASNPQMFTQVLNLSSQVGMDRKAFDCYSALNSLLGEPKNPSSMGSLLNNFVSSLEKPIDASSKAQAVSAANNFVSSLNSYATGLQNINNDVQQKIQASISSINSILKELSTINQKANANSDTTIQTKREDLIRELSGLISVQVAYTSNGGVEVRTQNGNQNLVVEGNYAQIQYQRNNTTLTSAPATGAMITFQYYDSATNNPTYSQDVRLTDIAAYQGEFSGLLKVSQKILPEALAKINDVAAQIQTQMNKYHNSGSGFPPATGFTSSKTMRGTDVVSFSGNVNFGLVNRDGTAAKDAQGNYLKPMSLNAAQLPSTAGPSGQFKIDDIIKELNNIASGYSQASVGLGAIPGPTTQPKQHLIDQVRMVAKEVKADGTVDVQLELASGSEYNVDFQVESVQVIDAAGNNFDPPVVNLPEVFTLHAGQRTKTGQQITAQLNNGDQINLIRMKLLVANKDTGIFEEAFVDFKIDAGIGNTLPGTQITNSRIEAVPARSVPGLAGPVLVEAKAAVATAPKMGGSGLVSASIDADGYLNISSGNTNLGLIVDSRDSQLKDPTSPSYILPQGFMQALGLNDLLVTSDKDNPAATLAVRADLVADPTLLAQAKASLFQQDRTTYVAGTQASAVVYLGANPNPNDTVVINGSTFTFVAAPPANAQQVQIGGASAATTVNLLAAIQNSPDIRVKDVITASNDGAGGIKITAIVAGDIGNNISIDSLIGGIAHVGLFTAPDRTTPLPTYNLQGGAYDLTNGANTTHLGKIPSFAYELDFRNDRVWDTVSSDSLNFYNGTSVGSQTLANFFGSFRVSMSNECKASEADLKADEKAFEALQVKYHNETRNTEDNRDKEMMDFISAIRSIEAIMAMLTQNFKAFEAVVQMARAA